MWLDQRFQLHSQGSEDSTIETGICAVSEDNGAATDLLTGKHSWAITIKETADWHCGREEEELTLPQDVIDNLLNDVHDSDREEEEDGDCILQNGIEDTLDSDDSLWWGLKTE